MLTIIIFFCFIPILTNILLAVNFILAPHNPYKEKRTPFECGIRSFWAQNRTQFTISFFIFGLLFLLFDLEILLVYPFTVSSLLNFIYGLLVLLIFILVLALGFVFELGKQALKIDVKQVLLPESRFITISISSLNFKLFKNLMLIKISDLKILLILFVAYIIPFVGIYALDFIESYINHSSYFPDLSATISKNSYNIKMSAYIIAFPIYTFGHLLILYKNLKSILSIVSWKLGLSITTILWIILNIVFFFLLLLICCCPFVMYELYIAVKENDGLASDGLAYAGCSNCSETTNGGSIKEFYANNNTEGGSRTGNLAANSSVAGNSGEGSSAAGNSGGESSAAGISGTDNSAAGNSGTSAVPRPCYYCKPPYERFVLGAPSPEQVANAKVVIPPKFGQILPHSYAGRGFIYGIPIDNSDRWVTARLYHDGFSICGHKFYGPMPPRLASILVQTPDASVQMGADGSSPSHITVSAQSYIAACNHVYDNATDPDPNFGNPHFGDTSYEGHNCGNHGDHQNRDNSEN